MEGDVLHNCGIFHIKELAILAIFGVPAGELVTRTGGIMDGSQIVCLGISDFFGLINRHLRVVGLAALGIKGHLAEVKKIAFSQVMIVINVRIVIIVCKQSICGGLVVFVVDGTIGNVSVDNRVALFIILVDRRKIPSRTSAQIILEGGQPGRKRNVFQT